MRTLGEAWTWYEHNRTLLNMMERLGDRYWSELPWDGRLGNDHRFRLLEGIQVADMARGVLGEFDDLAIFVMFSVFESIVRRMVAEDLQPEVAALRHEALQKSAAKLMQNIAQGSFSNNILELFKRKGQQPDHQPINSLVEEVNRVRHYRNWVAHGRKEADRPKPMLPRNAYDNMQAFLEHIRRPG